MDLDAYLITGRSKLAEMPRNWKERQLLVDYSSFLNKYLECKEFLAREDVLDAYSSIADAMHHWARIIIIEKGMQPGSNIWEQVKHIKIGVYKVYEELTTSRETVKQRVELVLLACEFSLMSKMKTCCSPIIRILEESERPLNVKELLQHDGLEHLRDRLPLILNKMAKKALIREVAVSTKDDFSVLELKYTK